MNQLSDNYQACAAKLAINTACKLQDDHLLQLVWYGGTLKHLPCIAPTALKFAGKALLPSCFRQRIQRTLDVQEVLISKINGHHVQFTFEAAARPWTNGN